MEIRHYISELPTTVEASSAKKIVMNNFGIKEAKFYYLFNQIRNPTETLKDTIKRLVKEGYEIVTEPYEIKKDEEYSFIIAVSPLMKSHFEKYGQWTSLDFTYNMVTPKERGANKYAVGCFVGLSSCKHIVPFALVIACSETKDVYYSIFRSFFDLMGGVPQTIITDEAMSIKGAIKDLAEDKYFEGVHLLDCYHILKNVKKNLKDRSLLKNLSNLVHARTKPEYSQALKDCYELAEDGDVDAIAKFDRNREQYCFSYAPLSMFGFSASDSIN